MRILYTITLVFALFNIWAIARSSDCDPASDTASSTAAVSPVSVTTITGAPAEGTTTSAPTGPAGTASGSTSGR